MILKRRLKKVFDEILVEVELNASFAERLLIALDNKAKTPEKPNTSEKNRRRRTAALLDPIRTLEIEGEGVLRSNLNVLEIEQLKDIVAEYGMDQAKLVMKWNTVERIIEHIVSTAISRSKKGDSFR